MKGCASRAGRPPRRRGAFTLVEILVATALLVIISLFLAAIAGQSSRVWLRGQGQIEYRERARAALDYIGRELQQAVLSPDPVDGPAAGPLEFAVDPATVAAFPNRDTVFWQAPIATDASRGDLAEIGYFVRWTGTSSSLCRFFVNPSDTANYQLPAAAGPGQWVSDALLDAVAPADAAHHYQGLFLEHVVGLWVNAYQADGTAYAGSSRTAGRLPASVAVSLVVLDAATAARMSAASAATIQDLCRDSSTATAMVSSASFPASLRAGASVVSIRVSPAAYK